MYTYIICYLGKRFIPIIRNTIEYTIGIGRIPR